MESKKIDKLGVKPSLLGFGCMRFPTLPDGKIDRIEAEKMLDKAKEEGVTYFDTAYTYHKGESEPFIGKVFKKYKRDSFYIATKLPIWEVKKIEDVRKIFDTQINRLETEYIDFYLLHCLNRKNWDKVKLLRIVEYFDRLKMEGKIRFLGFSFHDEYKVFKEIAESREWDFCQIHLNYMDTDLQAGIKGYKLTEKLNIPLIVMEPLKGGALGKIPEDIMKIFREIDKEASAASWALRWVAGLPNVKVVLSGMSTYDHVLDNLKTFKNFIPLNMTEEEAVEKVREAFKTRLKNNCTGCNYCMPCPNEVNIPNCFRLWNDLGKYGFTGQLQFEYWDGFENGKRADGCVECGECEETCPQNLPIREDLKKVALDFGKFKP